MEAIDIRCFLEAMSNEELTEAIAEYEEVVVFDREELIARAEQLHYNNFHTPTK